MDTPEARAYDVAFFDSVRRGALRSAEVIVPMLMDALHPTSVIDVGCAQGTWLAVFHSAGVQKILGLDGPWVDVASLEIPRSNFMVVDLERPIQLNRRFDLAISLEVAEHLAEEKADSFVASLVRLSPVVMFSAAIPFQGGTDHRNEQWQSYWAERFARHDFIAIDWIRSRVWDRVDVDTWYAQNTLIYVASADLAKYSELLREANRSRVPLALVHPRKYLQVVRMQEQAMQLADPRNMSLATFLLAFPAVCGGFLRRLLLR